MAENASGNYPAGFAVSFVEWGMGGEWVFAHTDEELLPVLEELRRREPIFHAAGFGVSREEYERAMASDYWEVGASGRRYSREYILAELEGKAPALAEALGWESWDHAVRRLGPDTYLITYVLRQGERVTRRATVWRRGGSDWEIVYHQGTVVLGKGEDAAAGGEG